ncbi:hypothetical protein FRC10_000405 [Ceratobasidium sp. 414]|nr:hypothetical protein FRC10_000405 [Ceratobasidium sp. 414]
MGDPVEPTRDFQALDPSTLIGASSHDITSTELGSASWFDFDLADANQESATSPTTLFETAKQPGQIFSAPLFTPPPEPPKTWANLASANSSSWGARASPAPTPAPNQRKTLNIYALFQGEGGFPTKVVEGPATAEASYTKLASSTPLLSVIPNHPSSLSTPTAAGVRPKRPVPGPLDLGSAQANRRAARPSALASAKMIEDLNAVRYPEAIKEPNPDLNITALPGKFRYDREFLLQFMNVCKEKPDSLPPLDAIGLEPSEPGATNYPGGVRQDRRRVGSMGTRSAPGIQRQGSIGLGLGNVSLPKGGFLMGAFQAPSRHGDSQSRFEASTAARRGAIGIPSPPSTTSRFTPVAHSESQGVVENASKPSDIESLLDQFTTEEFDLISDQIIEWVNEIKEEDGSTLMRVTKLIFEKAKDETAFSEMYARLCRELVDRLSPNLQDEASRNYQGQPVTGGSLFRKYLTNLCQKDFERGWSSEAATVTGKRQRLGVVRFIGELFKQQMLTERIMHECIKRLLSSVADPKEEEVESLCELLRTVGPNLDTAKARYHMNSHFERMQEMTKINDIDPGIQFMLQDVIELRQHWHAPPVVAQPPAPVIYNPDSHSRGVRGIGISRGRSRGRGSHRGGHYSYHGGYHGEYGQQMDGWGAAGGASASRPPAKAGDLSQFGKISKPTGPSFGPTSLFNQRDSGRYYMRGLRTSSKRNPFALLNDDDPQASRAVAFEGDARRKIWVDVEEYLGGEDVKEAIMALEKLPTGYHHIFVDKMVGAALNGGNKVVVLTEKLFAAIHKQQACSAEVFERGLLPTVEMADDSSIDVPKMYEWLARLMCAAGIGRARAEAMAGSINVLGEPRARPKDLLMQEFDKIPV